MRNTPTELVLLQIAEGLQTLAKNPDISAAIKDAYALSESEQKKADEARQIIASADAILADIKKREDALSHVEERIKEAEKLECFNADTLDSIRKQQAKIDSQEKINIANAKANEDESVRLKNISDALDDRADALANAEDNLAEARADLKKRADAMKELVA